MFLGEGETLDILLFAPMLILFIIYYKVFRISSDIKEIKEILKNNIKTEL